VYIKVTSVTLHVEIFRRKVFAFSDRSQNTLVRMKNVSLQWV